MARLSADAILVHEAAGGQLVEVKAGEFVSEQAIAKLNGASAIRAVKRLSPVLPVLSRKDTCVPFMTCAEMLRHDQGRNTPLWKLAVEYERARGGLTEAEVIAGMVDIVRILRRSIAQGLAGTCYDDRGLGHQCGQFTASVESRAPARRRRTEPHHPLRHGAGRAVDHADIPGHRAAVGSEESGCLRQRVLSVIRFSTEEEAVAMANDTNYGLAASFYPSLPKCMHPSPCPLPALEKTERLNRAGRGMKGEGALHGP